MNETTPHDPGSPVDPDQVPSLTERRFARRSPSDSRGGASMGGDAAGASNPVRAAAPLDRGLPLDGGELFSGLRVVLHECDRRAAVVRCLTSLRWLAQRGAEVVLFDGSGTRSSVDGSLQAVKRLFPFVAVAGPLADPLADPLARDGSRGLLDQATAPLTVNSPPPRWILALSADLEVDRFQMQALLRELAELPEGSLLVPRVIGPDGRPEAGDSVTRDSVTRDSVTRDSGAADSSAGESGAGAWLARRSDLMAGPFDQLVVHAASAASVLAPRPVRAR